MGVGQREEIEWKGEMDAAGVQEGDRIRMRHARRKRREVGGQERCRSMPDCIGLDTV
jgi:hypothetical protein